MESSGLIFICAVKMHRCKICYIPRIFTITTW